MLVCATDAGVRIGIDQFEIATVGTYVGISVRATPTPAALLGPLPTAVRPE
jgi:hypothetical protein